MTAIQGSSPNVTGPQRTPGTDIDYGRVPDDAQNDVQVAEREYARARGELFQKMVGAEDGEARAEARAELQELDNSFEEFAEKVTTGQTPATEATVDSADGLSDAAPADEIQNFSEKLQSINPPTDTQMVPSPEGRVADVGGAGDSQPLPNPDQLDPAGRAEAAREALTEAGLDAEISDERAQQIGQMFSTLQEVMPEKAGLASSKLKA